MTRKRSKGKGTALDSLTGFPGSVHTEADAEASGLSSFDSLPNETLLLILARLQFPSRQHASLVCRRWRDLLLEPPFCRHVAPAQSLSEALQACSPGDTLICPPGMYQETLLVDKPVRLVAEDFWWATLLSDQRQRWRRGPGRGPGGLPPPADAEIQSAAAAAATAESWPGHGPRQASAPSPMAVPMPRGGESQQQQHEPPPLPPQQQQQPPQRSMGSAAGCQQRGGHGRGPGVVAGGSGSGGAFRPPVPSVAVLSLRPPVVVMDSRCCFVGFEFHSSVVHNDVSICCFGPSSPLARFEHCTFSGLTGLRVPYSKGSQTRLELYDCTLIGTTQSLAAVQMDAGRLLMSRCTVQNNSVGLEVGPEALARLWDSEVRWCGTALVVDGCLAMARCRLWGNGKVGNLNTDARLRAAQSHLEACLAAADALPLPQQPTNGQQQEQEPARRSPRGPPQRRAAAAAALAAVTAAMAVDAAASPARSRGCGRGQRGGAEAAAAVGGGGATAPGTSTAGGSGAIPATSKGTQPTQPQALSAAAAAVSAGGSSGGIRSGTGPGGGSINSPIRVAALAASQWAEVSEAFACRRQLVRVVGCEVAAPHLIMRAGLHKDVRKKARELVRQVYGAQDVDPVPEWEVLVYSDLDSDMDEEDSSVTSGSGMADDEDLDLDDENEDPLDAADDPDLDESGESHSGSESDSDASSDSGSGSADMLGEEGMEGDEEGGAGGEADGEGEDEEWGLGERMTSGEGGSDSSGSDSSSNSDSDGGGISGEGGSDSSEGDGDGEGDTDDRDVD